jgi:hypothetical protein
MLVQITKKLCCGLDCGSKDVYKTDFLSVLMTNKLVKKVF